MSALTQQTQLGMEVRIRIIRIRIIRIRKNTDTDTDIRIRISDQGLIYPYRLSVISVLSVFLSVFYP